MSIPGNSAAGLFCDSVSINAAVHDGKQMYEAEQAARLTNLSAEVILSAMTWVVEVRKRVDMYTPE
jgi:hypothetical protein